MGWIISPSNDVLNYGDGSFLLPCRESNVDYSITYITDDGCSSNTVSYTYVTSGSCSSPVITCPDTQDVAVQTSSMQGVPSTGATITDGVKFYTGHTSFTSTGSITNLNNVTSATWGSDAGSGWKWLNITVPANGTSSSRSCSFTINMNTSNGTCSYPITFTQAGETCNCSNLIVNGTIE